MFLHRPLDRPSLRVMRKALWGLALHTSHYIIKRVIIIGPKAMYITSSVSLFGSFLLIMAALPAAFADQPSITLPISKESDTPTLDGVWTSSQEWTKAGVTIVNYTDGAQLVIRGKHDFNSLYILLEMPQDHVLDGHGAVCLDSLNDGGAYMQSDDYCLVLGNTLDAFRGDGRTTLMTDESTLNQFAEAKRGLSSKNSPYESEDHVTYEFKIPLKELGPLRTNYGLYVTYDTRGQTDNFTYDYSWPDSKSADYLRTASPRAWGQIFLSPDADVPEFPIPIIGVVAAIIGMVTIFSRTSQSKGIL
jgi:hypothetical protein